MFKVPEIAQVNIYYRMRILENILEFYLEHLGRYLEP